MKTVVLAASILALSTAPALAAPAAPAAPPPPAAVAPALSFYRLEVSITDGTAAPETYSMVLTENDGGHLESGANVATSGAGGNGPVNRQNVGTSLHFHYNLRDGVFVLDGGVEMSSIDPATTGSATPTIRRLKAESTALIVPGTPTLFASLYDPASKHHYEVTVSAKKLR